MKFKAKVRVTNHRGNTGWTVYVTTNLRHIQPRPPAGFMNGTTRGSPVVWESFTGGDTPGAAVGVGLRKLGELLEEIALPVDAKTEFKIEFETVGTPCEYCGLGDKSSTRINQNVVL